MLKIKQKILETLNCELFPDLKIIFSKPGLNVIEEILQELLQEEELKFKQILKIKNKDLNFESFEYFSKLNYLWSILNHLENVNSCEKLRTIIENYRPKIQDFYNKISYSKRYFSKLLFLEKNYPLDIQQKRIIFLRIKAFRDRGINLDLKKQKILKKINKKLSKLQEKFSNNVVDDEKIFSYLINDFQTIKDLPKEVLDTAKKAGEKKGGYLFDSDPSSYIAIMKYCSCSRVRKDFELNKNLVASRGKFSNKKIVLQILKLRQEKAKILGYKNYAQMSLSDKMAKSEDVVIKLLKDILLKARKKAKNDLFYLKKYFSLKKINSFDIAYYSRILKEKKYSIDEKQIKKFFDLEDVLSYLFNFVKTFYGIELKKIYLESYDKELRIYEVYKDSKLISYYFLDLFYKNTKRPGAWADNLREKQYFPQKKIPIIINCCNFQKNIKGNTTLYLRDVETIFHEFGHALHEILSESKYSELSGFNVEWDFVELPSQLMENWVKDKVSLKKLSKHIETGDSLSDNIINTLDGLKKFMSGIFILRQLEFSIMDITIHRQKALETIVDLDRKILSIVNSISIFRREKNYNQYCSFTHLFDGGYAAGYYSYMWAEILETQVWEKIRKLGAFKRETGDKLLKSIIGQGSKKEAKDLFFDFTGEDIDKKAFLSRYF